MVQTCAGYCVAWLFEFIGVWLCIPLCSTARRCRNTSTWLRGVASVLQCTGKCVYVAASFQPYVLSRMENGVLWSCLSAVMVSCSPACMC